MAGSGMSFRRGFSSGRIQGAGEGKEDVGTFLEKGYGTPTHVAPQGTHYIKLDATVGSSSVWWQSAAPQGATWRAMSDYGN